MTLGNHSANYKILAELDEAARCPQGAGRFIHFSQNILDCLVRSEVPAPSDWVVTFL